MTALTQAETLALWESGQAFHPIDQGLLAVQAAFPEARQESVADWPLGRRNRALAELYCACFGPTLSGWTACRQCGEKLQFSVDGDAVQGSGAPATADTDAPWTVTIDGRVFRLPTSRDLARLAGFADPSEAATQLLDLCVVREGNTEAAEAWSESDVEAIGEKLALADPLAEILLDFHCPLCGETFQESLDLAGFFWSELEGRAKRLLLDVHTLAMAYGWSEADVLSLSPARRNFYLEQVQG
jgi:hypothetical protein